jgi:glycosyl hydrolase family 12
MKSRIRSAAVAVLVTIGTMAAYVTATQTSQAQEQICDQFGTGTIQDQYVAQNNAWGTSEAQCISVTDSGFQVTQADGTAPTDGPPKSYPSVFLGCHYTLCSPGTNLPLQLSSISSATSEISYTFVDDAVYNASYDIWLDPEPKTDGVSQTEIMIWLNRVGDIQPIGSQTGTATVAGQEWEVWTGNNGSNDVISFVAPSAMSSYSFDVMAFIDQAISAGMATEQWYLTSIQAGFEPWEGGAGLGVASFSATVN